MPENTDELLANIISEKNKGDSHDRYPIRFLFFPLSSELSPYLFTLINKLSLKVKRLSDYFPEDKWATWENIYDKIEKEIANNTSDILFIGLSEYLRFETKQNVESIFVNLVGLENTFENRRFKRRAYFLMDSFEKLFTNLVVENHHRNVFYDPIIRGENNAVHPELKKPELVISGITTGEENILKTVREYLDVSTKTDYLDFEKSIYCSSRTIINLASRFTDFLEDTLFTYSVIDNPQTVLTKKIIGLTIAEYLAKDTEFIKWLASDINMDSKQQSFEEFALNKLNLESLTIEKLLMRLFNSTQQNEKKLVFLTFETIGKVDSKYAFVNYLLTNYKINTKQEFIKQLYLCTDMYVLNAAYKERKQIIEIIKKQDGEIEAPEGLLEVFSSELIKVVRKNIYLENDFQLSIKDSFRQKLLTKTNSKEKVDSILYTYKQEFVNKVLTLNSQLEKRITVLLASNYVFEDSDLENIYPELYGYLYYSSLASIGNRNLDSYFYQYKMSKISNEPSTELKDYISNHSSQEFLEFYNNPEFKNIDSTLKAKHIFVFDGVGAEYMSLISYLFEKENGLKLTSVDYRKALLPTITSTNKELIDTLKPSPVWLQNFDSEIIHGESYSVERNVEKAISLLQQMVKSVIEMSNGESFIVIADHGCTAAHKIFKAVKKYDAFATAEHDGRCYKISGNPSSIKDSEDYIKYVDRKGTNWIIPVKYISLNNTARYEAHGGGTLEEIFVPMIYYAGSDQIIEYSINVFKKQVSGLDRSIKFTVTPQVDPEEIIIREETGVISKPFISEGAYICNLSTGRAQKVTIKIKSFEETIEVTSSSGINSNNGGFF